MKRLILWFRERESFKPAFTLVEMLIVVVLIGILWAAILPRFSWYLERTRDLKRQADLRNIAAAVERYKNNKGVFPTRWEITWEEYTWGTFQTSPIPPCETFERALSPYITSIPKDPQSNSIVRLHRFAVESYPNYFYGDFKVGKTVSSCDGRATYRWIQGVAVQPWQYFYQIFKRGGNPMAAAIVVAKVETPDAANYIRFKDIEDLRWGFFKRNWTKQIAGEWTQEISSDIEDLKLCTSIEKVSKGEESFEVQGDKQVNCKYSSEDQLYYIIKIE